MDPDAAPAVPATHPGATHRLALAVDPDEVEVVAPRLWAAGAIGIWERPGEVVAWFAERPSDAALPDGGRWDLEPDRDWQAEWKATIGPVRAGRIVVVPTWLADVHLPGEDELTLVLDPGRAFGSGHHATTILCLEALDALPLAGRAVADIGCGSGILAIAAAASGAEVQAVDLDRDAIAVTCENAARHGLEIAARVGSVEAVRGPVDVVVANLVTDTIGELAHDLVELSRGWVIVSGITETRAEAALTPLRDAGLRIDTVRVRDGWICAGGTPTTGDRAAGP